MAKGTIKISHNYLNPYEYYHSMLKGNALFDEDGWTNAYNNGSLPQYISMITSEDAPTLSTMNEKYGYDYLDAERKQIALYNEEYADRTNVQSYDREFVNENGETQKTTYEMTQYEYTKMLLQEAKDIELQQRKLEAEAQAKNEMHWIPKVLSTAFVTPILNLASGITNFGENIYNMFEGVIEGTGEALQGGSFDAAFRKAFTDYDVSDQFKDWIFDWERKNSYTRDINGNYTFVGAGLAQVSSSIGEMLPTLLLSYGVGSVLNAAVNSAVSAGSITATTAATTASAVTNTVGKAAHAIYYTGMASGTFKELSREMPTVPTMTLVLNSAVKTVAEAGIEMVLGKAFGPSNMDKLHFGYAPGNFKGSAPTKVLKEFAKDFVQEGTEELLQELSGYFVDEAFQLFNKEFGGLEDLKLSTLIDAFVLGGISTIATNSFSLITTKRVAIANVKYDSNGKLVEDKKTYLSKAKSWLYNQNLSQMFSAYEQAINDKKLSQEQREALLGQMYVSLRTISSFYGEVGQERFDAAVKLYNAINNNNYELQRQEDIAELNSKIADLNSDVNANKESIAEYQKTVSELEKMPMKDYKKLLTERAMSDLVSEVDNLTKANTEKLIEKSKATQLSEVVNKNNKDAKSKSVDAKSQTAANISNDIFDKDDSVESLIFTEDGERPVRDGDTILIPIKLANLGDTELIYKSVSEALLADIVASGDVFEPMLSKFEEIYKKMYNVSEVDYTELIYNILFNDKFFQVLLYSSNKDAIKFLDSLGDTVDDISVNNYSSKMFKYTATEAYKNIKKQLIEYFINQQNIIPETMKSLSAEEARFVRAKRYSKDLRNKIVAIDGLKKLTESDKTLLTNRINSIPVKKESKDKLLKDIFANNSITRESAINTLDRLYDYIFTGPYNDIVYKKSSFVGDVILNQFLMDLGLTLETANDYRRFPEYLREEFEEKYSNELAREDSESYDDVSSKMFIREKFNEFTNGAFSLDYDFNVTYNEKTATKKSEFISNDEKNLFTVLNKFNVDTFKDILKPMPSTLLNYITVTDLVTNLEQYVDLTKLKSYYLKLFESDESGKYFDEISTNVYGRFEILSDYVYNKTSGKYSIINSNNGEFNIVRLLDGNKFIKSDEVRTLLKNKPGESSNYRLSNLLKGFDFGNNIKNIKIKFYKANDGRFARFSKARNTISINEYYIPSNEDDAVKHVTKRLLHEIHHAYTTEISNIRGFTDKVTFSSDVRSDLDAHWDIDTSKMSDTDIAENLYKDSLGEMLARGEIPEQITFIVNEDKIITPWGSIYYIMFKNGNIHLISQQEFVPGVTKTLTEYDASEKHKVKGTYNKTRRVSKKLIENNPRFKAFYNEQLSQPLQQLIRTFDLNNVNKSKVNSSSALKLEKLIISGKLNRDEVFKILNNADTSNMDDYTLSVINDAFFKNPHVKDVKTLELIYSELAAEMLALQKTLIRRDAETGSKYSDKLFKQMSISEMQKFLDEITSDKLWGLIYEVELTKIQIGAITDSNRVILESFDGTMDSLASIANKFTKISDSESVRHTKLNEAITSDKQIKYGRGDDTNVDTREQLISELLQYYMIVYKERKPDVSKKRLEEISVRAKEQLDKYSYNQLKSEWNKFISSNEKLKNAGNVINYYKKISKEESSRLRGLANIDRRKILSKVNSFNNIDKSKFLSSELSSKYFELSSDGNSIVFKNNILRNSAINKPIKLDQSDATQIHNDLNTIWKNLNDNETYDSRNKEQIAKMSLKQTELKEKLQRRLEYSKKQKERLQEQQDKSSALKSRIEKEKEATSKQKELKEKYKEKASNLREANKELKSQNRELRKEFKTVQSKLGPTKLYITYSDDSHNSPKMPYVLKDILSFSFRKFADSTIPFALEQNMVINGKVFFKENGEVLSRLSEQEIIDIVEFYKSTSINEADTNANDLRKYKSFMLYILGYFAELHNNKYSGVKLSNELLSDIEEIVQKQGRLSGTILPIVGKAIKDINPLEVIAESLEYVAGIKLDDAQVNQIVNTLNNTDFADKNSVDRLVSTFQHYYDIAAQQSENPNLFYQLVKFQRMCMLSSPGTWIRNWTSNKTITITNKFSDSIGEFFLSKHKNSKYIEGQWKITGVEISSEVDAYTKTVFEDSGLMDLLSISNKYTNENDDSTQSRLVSVIKSSLNSKLFHENQFVAKGNTKSKTLNKVIDKSNKLLNNISNLIYKKLDDSKFVKNSALKYFKAMLQQYVNEKYNEISVKEKLVNDKIDKAKNKIDDLKKYKELFDKNNKRIEDLKNELQTLSNNNSVEAIKRVGELQSELDKLKSENKSITPKVNSFISAKRNLDTLETNLKAVTDMYSSIFDSSNIPLEILDIFADAYTLASHDYMHKPNFFNKIEQDIKEHCSPAAYFVYKQILPFASSGWNWFVEGLKYTPAGLIRAIWRFNKMEQSIEQDKAKFLKDGSVPPSSFTQYLIKRDLGKGVLGSIGLCIGIALALFGAVGIEEDEYDRSLKIKIGDVYIDISDVFGTQSIFWGMSIVSSVRKAAGDDPYDMLDFVSDILDQMFMESTLGDVFDIFRYDDTLGQYVTNHLDDSLRMFVFNIITTISSVVYPYKAQYGYAQENFLRRISGYLPFVNLAHPRRYDPYTGEVQSKYTGYWLGDVALELLNKLSPIKISPNKVSDAEKTALLLGVKKGELKGIYNEETLDAKNLSKLNEYYGKLNAEQLNILFSNTKRYKVLDTKTNTYKTLTYNNMNNEQKKSVIERIMNDNAKTAKIYVLTSKGYKYYTTQSELQYLKSLGIKNVYLESRYKHGFVK